MSVDAVMVGPDPQVKDSGGIVADTREKRLLGQYSGRRFYFRINIATRQRADHNTHGGKHGAVIRSVNRLLPP